MNVFAVDMIVGGFPREYHADGTYTATQQGAADPGRTRPTTQNSLICGQ